MTIGDYDLRGRDYETKVCGKCKESRALSDFHKNPTRSDGLHNECKSCVKSYKKSYYQRNKARVREKNKAYWERNREKLTAYSRERWAAKGDVYNRNARARKRTVEGWAANRLSKCKRADAARGIECDLTAEHLVSLLEATGFVCPVLGIQLRLDGRDPDAIPTVDAFNPALGHVAGNISVISDRANRIKRDATTDEVVALAAWMKRQGGCHER